MTDIEAYVSSDSTAPALLHAPEVPDYEVATPSPERKFLGHLATARRRINPRLLSEEPLLLESKWYDYRYLSAVEATEHFAQCYLKQWRLQFGRVRDIEEAAEQKPIQVDRFLSNNPRILTGLWRARQVADRHGIDYDFFIGTALRTADKALWCRFPLPSQLYSEKVLANILKEWKEFGPAPVAKREVDDQHFLAANFLAEPPQVAFEDELIRHGNTLTDRTSLIRFIAMTVFMQHRLRQSRAEAEFGTEVIAQARDMAEPEETEQLPMQELSPYKPACLGLIQPSASPECSSQCSFADRCMALRDATSARLKSIHHSEDPWIDEMRAKARERKRRERARKRALKHGV